MLRLVALRLVALPLAMLALSGCDESLFGAHHAGPTEDAAGGHDGDVDAVSSACAAPCVADAVADFNGMTGGSNGRWRYLEDLRDRQWSPMTASNGELTSTDGNRISTCALHGDAPACAALPGSLLVASGAAASTDPAIEFNAPIGQVLQLALHAAVPPGGDRTILVYRNSREDALFTAAVAAGGRLDQAITLDALPGDRFLVAIVPGAGDATADVALQLYITAADKPFPSSCELALRFDDPAAGNSATDLLCRSAAFTHLDSAGRSTPITQASAPFIELGHSISIAGGTYLSDLVPTDILDYTQDVTVQLWIKLESFVGADPVWLFSDLDPGGTAGGNAVTVAPRITRAIDAPVTMTAMTRTDPASSGIAAAGLAPAPVAWLFVRVVRSGTRLALCVNGVPIASADVGATKLAATRPPTLGVEAPAMPAVFDGFLDDVRVIRGALPCN